MTVIKALQFTSKLTAVFFNLRCPTILQWCKNSPATAQLLFSYFINATTEFNLIESPKKIKVTLQLSI